MRLCTNTEVTHSHPSSSALSTVDLSLIFFVARSPSSAVRTTLHCESTMRARSASAENPAKTTEWIAPIRAHASIAYAASGTIGMYRQTRSPLRTPRARSALASWHVPASASPYVIRFTSVGSSPSQMIAVWSGGWRSRQLTETLSIPSGNHATLPPAKSPRHTVFGGTIQSSRSAASFAQNVCGSFTDASHFER